LHVAVAGRAAQSRIVRSAVLIGCGAVISENPAGHRVIGSVTVAGRRGLASSRPWSASFRVSTDLRIEQ
jgi:hypothetical protein